MCCSAVSSSFGSHGSHGACQAPLSTEFSRQKYCSDPGDLPDQGSNPRLLCLLHLQLDSLPLHHLGNRILWYCGSIKEEVCRRWSQEVFPEKWASVLDLNMHIQADGFAQNDSFRLAYILLPCWDLSILPAIYLSPFHEILTFQLEVT